MARVLHWLRRSVILALALSACFATGVWGVLHGWHLERRSPDELSALLRRVQIAKR